MTTYAEGLALIEALAITRLNERVAIADAGGRVLMEDVRLGADQPGFDRATMDGYALALSTSENLGVYRVIATVVAGSRFNGVLNTGEAVRIMTGAPAPAGTAVVPIELTDRGMPTMRLNDGVTLKPGANIARRGEDGHAGDVVIAAGTRLTPTTVAVAAMAGTGTVLVARLPRVALITTGDEVNGIGDAAIHDSNGPFLSAFAHALGVIATRTHARDDADALRDAINVAAREADVIVTTGGVSAGDRDLVPPTAAALGFVPVFHHLAMQPGKPVLLAQRSDGRLLVGLPGNPVSVLATAHLVLWPMLARFGGICAPRWQRLPLAMAWAHRGNRQLFLPARIDGGQVTPIRWNGSGDLIAAASGDALIDLAPGSTHAAGDLVHVLPYVGHDSHTAQRGVLPPRA